MIEFLRAGGFGMVIVLVVGLATLGTAVLFARRPDERRMAMLRALTLASLFSTLTAVASNMATVFYKVPQHPEWSKAGELGKTVLIGMGESLTPAILCGAFLTISWVVAAVGLRRLAERLGQFAEVPAAG
jgi:predicted benzoate:H+ symporter BenE